MVSEKRACSPCRYRMGLLLANHRWEIVDSFAITSLLVNTIILLRNGTAYFFSLCLDATLAPSGSQVF